MERRLIEAANAGDVDKLHNLINDYPVLLRSVALAGGDTPLHIACIGGHVNFVKEVMNLRPKFAEELNQDGLSPLHIASANGDIEIVKELLKLGSDLCLVQGKEKRIPFHFAVAKGRIHVIKDLLSACLDSIREVTARGETCFHLVVKNNQFKAFEVLCELVVAYDKEDILNFKDEQGNTILHLAASRKQYEFIDLLLDKNFGYKGNFEVNSLNQAGLTPLDVLVSEGGDCEIEKLLTLSGATRAAVSPQNSVIVIEDSSHNRSGQEQRRDQPRSSSNELLGYFKRDRITNSPSKVRNTLLVMAVLIATAAYSSVLSPPGGVWQDNSVPDAKNSTSNDSSTKKPAPPYTPGTAVMASHAPVPYCLFLVSNSIGFFSSLRMMYLLTLGLPLQFELQLALFALTTTYAACMVAITPSSCTNMFLVVLLVVSPSMLQIVTWVARDHNIGRWFS